MENLTFQTVMDFCKPHNQSVFRKIVEAQKNGTLSPFVGAGLSVPFGYKLWGSVLAELADYILDEDQKKQALKQVKACQYEEAAETILHGYPYMLDMLPGIVDQEILNNCADEKKRSSAAWVIPYLFKRELVMTTNFDRVLEECYQTYQSAAIPTVTPLNQDRLAQLQLNQELCLLKLHGDIGKEAVSIDDLVFTGEQYNEHYTEGTPLVSVLTQRFSSRRMLFLGCSLNVDRTMEILRKVITAKKGIRHFAILGCKASEVSERSVELQKLGILPIFYDDSNHNAVRVILERLLEETDSEGYKQLRRSCRSLPTASEEKRPLMFDAEFIPFSGREDQLEYLGEFCKAEYPLLWWAVTGPGGMGKSRLVFEFCKRMEKEGWTIQRFEANPSRSGNAQRLEELTDWMPEVNKTIVVLDDVQAYIEPVRDWLVGVGRIHRSEELRILLLEREGRSITDTTWLGSDFQVDHLDEWCYDEQFLHLEPLTDEQIISVMNDYAKANGKSLNAELLLKTLEKIDPKLKRPLYAIAIADARCQGKDPTNWDRGKILDTLLERELDFHLNRLQGISDRKVKISKTLRTQMELLLADACINGLLVLDQVDWTQYDLLQKRMKEVEMDPEEFCLRLGILRTVRFHQMSLDENGNPIDGSEQIHDDKIVFLTCPDLLKEHLVLKLAFEKKKLELLPDGWQYDPNRMKFLRRLWIDYPERLKDQTVFWDQFFSVDSISGLPASFYADLLWGVTDIFPEFSTKAVGILEELHNKNTDDEEIAICYARGLLNLSIDQSMEECASTISQLESLYQSHPDCLDIAEGYAQGLVHLSSIQPMEDCADTIARLALFYHDHPAYTGLAIQYAQSLLHLSQKQSPDNCIKTVDQLDKLYHSHPDLVHVAFCYAQVLFYLTQSRTVEDCMVAVDRSEKLYHAHSTRENIVVCYTKCLANLSCVQPLEDCSDTVNRLEELYVIHSDLMDVASSYATGLVNLSCENTLENKGKAVEQLKKLYNSYPDCLEIGIGYAKGLVNLSCLDTLESCTETVKNLEEVYNAHPDCMEIVIQYAKGLVNLSCQNTPENRTKVVKQLKNLYTTHHEWMEMSVCYARGLRNLVDDNVPGDYASVVEQLNTLRNTHPEWMEIEVEYANALVNLAFVQTTETEVQITLDKSKEILQKHPDHVKIQLATAKTQFNLTLVQKKEDIPDTVAQICTFLREHSSVIPEFREALDEYLSKHPDHTQRYQPLLEL